MTGSPGGRAASTEGGSGSKAAGLPAAEMGCVKSRELAGSSGAATVTAIRIDGA